MRRIRLVLLAVVVVAVVVLFTLPAWAHVTVISATTVPGDADQVIRFNAPIERDANNADLLIAMDSAWRPVSCEAPAGWTCSATTEAGRPAFRFTAGAPNDAETFIFTAHSPSAAGTWAFPAIQTYDDGQPPARWIGPPGSEEPAPTITTTAAPVTTAPPATPAPTAAPTVAPTTRAATPSTVAPAASTTTPVTASSTTSSTVARSTSTTSTTIAEVRVNDDDDSGGTSALPFVIGGVVVVGAGAGGVAYYLRKRGTSAPPGEPPAL